MKILSTACANTIHFFYPAYCLHCEGKLKWPTHLICGECSHQIEWIDRRERCPRCWGPRHCKSCLPLHPHRSLFENSGPIASLYAEYLITKRSALLASLLVVGLSKTKWEIPDAVVPLTKAPLPKEDPAYFLAKDVANLLKCPCYLPSEKVEDQIILLIEPFLLSGPSLFTMKKEVAGFFPKKIFSIALIDARL